MGSHQSKFCDPSKTVNGMANGDYTRFLSQPLKQRQYDQTSLPVLFVLPLSSFAPSSAMSDKRIERNEKRIKTNEYKVAIDAYLAGRS